MVVDYFIKKEYNIENPEFSEMSGIMEKDQKKRIYWNRKEALNNQSPKHSSQRIFMVSEQLHYITNREEIFDFSNKKCRIHAACGVSQTPNFI